MLEIHFSNEAYLIPKNVFGSLHLFSRSGFVPVWTLRHYPASLSRGPLQRTQGTAPSQEPEQSPGPWASDWENPLRSLSAGQWGSIVNCSPPACGGIYGDHLGSYVWHQHSRSVANRDVSAGRDTSCAPTRHTLLRFVGKPEDAEACLPVDMLSPGDMPSSTGCSVDCGLEAEGLPVGG